MWGLFGVGFFPWDLLDAPRECYLLRLYHIRGSLYIFTALRGFMVCDELSANLIEASFIDNVCPSAVFLTVRQPPGIRAISGSPAMSGSPAVAAKEKKGSMRGNMGSSALISTDPSKGTRDFPPEEMRMRTWLFNNFREVGRFWLPSILLLACMNPVIYAKFFIRYFFSSSNFRAYRKMFTTLWWCRYPDYLHSRKLTSRW